jgi:hypothetical protein
MPQTIQQPGVTFAVDEVTPAAEPLPEWPTHEAVQYKLRVDTRRGEIESCCGHHGTVIQEVYYQPLLAAVFLAFSQHGRWCSRPTPCGSPLRRASPTMWRSTASGSRGGSSRTRARWICSSNAATPVDTAIRDCGSGS